MAGTSDGSIIINSELDNEGFERGSDKLLAAIKDLTNAVDNLGDNMMQSFKDIIAIMQQTSGGFTQTGKAAAGMGKSATQSIGSLEKETLSLLNKLSGLQASAEAGFTTPTQVRKFEQSVAELGSKMEATKEKVRAFGETEFKNDQLEALLNQADELEEKLKKVAAVVKQIEAYETTGTGAFPSSSQMEPYGGTAAGARKVFAETLQQYNDLMAKIEQIKAKTGAMPGGWLGSETADYERMVGNLEKAQQLIDELRGSAGSSIPAPSVDVIGRFQTLHSAISSASRAAIGFVSSMARLASSAISKGVGAMTSKLKQFSSQASQADAFAKKLTHTLTSLKRLLITRIKRMFISKIFTTIKQDLQELARYSDNFNQSMSNLKNAATGMAANLSVSLGGLISAIEPILTRIINLISTAITYLNAFFALLGGKTVMTVAKKQVGSYAGGLDAAGGAAGKAAKAQEELNEAIYGFDELNKRSDANDSSGGSGGGGGGGGGAGDLFEQVPVDSVLPESIADFAKRLKDAIAAEDWEGVGKVLASGLNSVISKIDDWNENTLRPKAVKWASNFARIMNGFFEGWDAEATGSTLGGLINTVLDTVNTAVTTFDWAAAGKKFAEGINGLFDRVDWSLFGTTIGNAIAGFWTMISNWAKSANWAEYGKKIAEGLKSLLQAKPLSTRVEAIVSVFNGLITSLSNFVQNAPWDELTAELTSALSSVLDIDIGDLILDLGTLIINFVHSLAEAVEENKGKFYEFGKKVGDALGQLNWGQLLTDIGSIIINGIVMAIAGLGETDFGKIAMAIAGGLAAIKIGGGVLSLLATFGKVFGTRAVTEVATAVGSEAASTTIMGGLKTAISSAFSALVPLLPTIAGVAALAAAIAGLAYVISLRFTTEGADEARQELKSITDKIDELKQNTDSGQYAIDGKKIIADELLARYQELATKTDLTGTEQGELKEITNELVKIFPELSGLVDEESGYFKTDADNIAGVVAELTRLAKVRGLQGALSTAWDTYGTAVYYASEQEAKLKNMMELRDAIQNRDLDTIGKHKDLVEECGISYDGLISAITAAQDPSNAYGGIAEANSFWMTKLNATIDAQQEAVDGLNGKVEDASSVCEELSAQLGYLEAGFDVSNHTISGSLKSYANLKTALEMLAVTGEITESQYATLMAQLEESESSGATAEQALSDLETSLGDLGITVVDTSGDVQDSMEEITSSMEGAADSAGPAAEDLVSTYSETISNGAEDAETAATEVAESAVTGLGSKADEATTEGENYAVNYKDGMSAKKLDVETEAEGIATSATKKLASKNKEAGTAGSNTVTTYRKGISDGKTQTETDAQGVAAGASKGLDSKTADSKTIGTNSVDNMRQGISSMLERIKGEANNTAYGVYTAFNSKTEAAKTVGTTYGENLYNGINSKLQGIKDLANSIGSDIYNGLTSKSGSVYSAGYYIGQQMYNGLNAWTSSVVGIARNMAKDSVSAMSSQSGYNSGYYLAQGMYNGIVDMAYYVVQAASDMAYRTINTIRSILRIGSPSKVTTEFGKFFDEGFIVGVEKKEHAVLNTVSDMAKGVVEAAQPGDVDIGMSANALTDGLDSATQKLSAIAQIFSNISSSFNAIGSIPIPDILRGSAAPVKTAIGAVSSLAAGGTDLGGVSSSLETQNGLLRQQNQLLQELVANAGGTIDVSSILGGINRANRRAGKAVI